MLHLALPAALLLATARAGAPEGTSRPRRAAAAGPSAAGGLDEELAVAGRRVGLAFDDAEDPAEEKPFPVKGMLLEESLNSTMWSLYSSQALLDSFASNLADVTRDLVDFSEEVPVMDRTALGKEKGFTEVQLLRRQAVAVRNETKILLNSTFSTVVQAAKNKWGEIEIPGVDGTAGIDLDSDEPPPTEPPEPERPVSFGKAQRVRSEVEHRLRWLEKLLDSFMDRQTHILAELAAIEEPNENETDFRNMLNETTNAAEQLSIMLSGALPNLYQNFVSITRTLNEGGADPTNATVFDILADVVGKAEKRTDDSEMLMKLSAKQVTKMLKKLVKKAENPLLPMFDTEGLDNDTEGGHQLLIALKHFSVDQATQLRHLYTEARSLVARLKRGKDLSAEAKKDMKKDMKKNLRNFRKKRRRLVRTYSTMTDLLSKLEKTEEAQQSPFRPWRLKALEIMTMIDSLKLMLSGSKNMVQRALEQVCETECQDDPKAAEELFPSPSAKALLQHTDRSAEVHEHGLMRREEAG